MQDKVFHLNFAAVYFFLVCKSQLLVVHLSHWIFMSNKNFLSPPSMQKICFAWILIVLFNSDMADCVVFAHKKCERAHANSGDGVYQ